MREVFSLCQRFGNKCPGGEGGEDRLGEGVQVVDARCGRAVAVIRRAGWMDAEMVEDAGRVLQLRFGGQAQTGPRVNRTKRR